MGWISLYRSIKKHWIFENDKFFKWWIIILFEVNHSETKVNIGYNIYELHKGQSAKSIRTWANLFNCGTKQATKFFDLLEKDNMITREILGKGKQSSTLINVTNYNEYQTQEKRNVPIKGNARETQGKRNRHTDNNYNNYNNEKNDNKKEIIPYSKKEKLFSEDVLNCYDCLINFFPENLWPKKKEDWLDTIDKLNRIDNVPFEKIIELTKKAREDCFWSGTFLSLKKLRTKNNDGIMYIVVFNEKFKKKKLTPTEKIFETAKKNLENW